MSSVDNFSLLRWEASEAELRTHRIGLLWNNGSPPQTVTSDEIVIVLVAADDHIRAILFHFPHCCCRFMQRKSRRMVSPLSKAIVVALCAFVSTAISSVAAIDGTRKNSIRREEERKEFGRLVDEAAVELLFIR